MLDKSEARVIDLDTWALLNLKIDDFGGVFPHRIAAIENLNLNLVSDALKGYAIQHVGILDFYRRFMSDLPSSSPGGLRSGYLSLLPAEGWDAAGVLGRPISSRSKSIPALPNAPLQI